MCMFGDRVGRRHHPALKGPRNKARGFNSRELRVLHAMRPEGTPAAHESSSRNRNDFHRREQRFNRICRKPAPRPFTFRVNEGVHIITVFSVLSVSSCKFIFLSSIDFRRPFRTRNFPHTVPGLKSRALFLRAFSTAERKSRRLPPHPQMRLRGGIDDWLSDSI